MIVYILRVFLLVIRVKAAWPAYGYDEVVRVARTAVDNETDAIPAELLVAISQHESDMKPRAITWVDSNGRHDIVLRDDQRLDHAAVVYGYLQAMCLDHVERCNAEMEFDGGMRAGVAELVEWSDTCVRWNPHAAHVATMRCVLRGHAGGTKCAQNEDACKPEQRAFVRLFIDRAYDLSHTPARSRLGA